MSQIKAEKLAEIPPVDLMLYQEEHFYEWSLPEILRTRHDFIIPAFHDHWQRCDVYRRYCRSRGVSPDQITGLDDLGRIPQMPTTIFKKWSPLSVPRDSVSKVCCSSGTRGVASRVYRDDDTLYRFLGTVRANFEQVLDIFHARVINLGPSSEECGDTWFSYVMSLIEMLHPTKHLVTNNCFDVEHAVQEIARLSDQCAAHEHPMIIGPPVLFVHVLDYIERNMGGIEVRPDTLMLTAGGWKRAEGQAVSRDELEERAVRLFPGFRQEQFRDGYNMVELNTTLLECEKKRKHVPPWLRLTVRDFETLEEVPAGQEGLIGFLDPLPSSYPGFILSDDIGFVYTDPCPCNRTGETMQIVRRVAKVQARGCALRFDKTLYIKQEVP